jgi:hypothetical protein
LQDPPKFPQIEIFGLKKCHLATSERAKVPIAQRKKIGRGGHCWFTFVLLSVICQAIHKPRSQWSDLSGPFLTGLPDFSWYNVPKREKIYQTTTKYTKCQ